MSGRIDQNHVDIVTPASLVYPSEFRAAAIQLEARRELKRNGRSQSKGKLFEVISRTTKAPHEEIGAVLLDMLADEEIIARKANHLSGGYVLELVK
jgi:hypothetical protein